MAGGMTKAVLFLLRLSRVCATFTWYFKAVGSQNYDPKVQASNVPE